MGTTGVADVAGPPAKWEVTVQRRPFSVVEHEQIRYVLLQQALIPASPRPDSYSCGGGAGGETGMAGGRAANTLPCLTLRDNTERPETITIGTNELIGTDPKTAPTLAPVMNGQWKKVQPSQMGRQGVRADR